MASRWLTTSVGLVTVACALVARTAQAQEEGGTGGEALPGPADEKPEPKRSALYLDVGVGLGYASLSEDRPDAKNPSSASEVSATGFAVPVYAALGYRVGNSVAVGGALLLADQPSPSIDYKLIGVGTPVIEAGGAFGGLIGPMAAFQVSQSIELNAALGYGGFGRSAPHPGFGGKGFMYSLAGEYQLPASPKLAITMGLRLTGGFMSYDDGSEGTYKSTLVLPALTAGFAFR
ncbi:MAG TPA: hypothetical protein VHB79_29790 [Polyangiaceae bacterium]|nr:hypothetical protein [Polyangiaceae bacterium]